MDISSVTSFFANITFDWIFLLCVALLAGLDSMRGGSTRAAALALSFPLLYIVAQFAPTAQFVAGIQQQFSSNIAQALFAGLILFLCFLLLYRITDGIGGEGGFLQSAAAGFGLAAMIGLFWPLIPALNALYEPGPQLAQAFGEAYRFWWLLVALASLAFSRR